MASAKETVVQLAAVCGGDMSEFRTVDKYLADGDLRRRAAGRQRLDVTRREMLRLLLGVMGAPVKSRPVQYVKDVQKFRLSHVNMDRGDESDVEKAIGMTPDAIRETDLLDVLEQLSALLAERGDGWGPRVWLEVEQSGYIAIQFDGDDCRGEAIFIGSLDFTAATVADLKRTATVSSHTLAWIGANGVAD